MSQESTPWDILSFFKVTTSSLMRRSYDYFIQLATLISVFLVFALSTFDSGDFFRGQNCTHFINH